MVQKGTEAHFDKYIFLLLAACLQTFFADGWIVAQSILRLSREMESHNYIITWLLRTTKQHTDAYNNYF